MPTTEQNLSTAFSGESQANRKYALFAEKADAEGLPQVARLFRAAAEAETVHARNHLNAMNGIKDTNANLRAAVAGEHYEFTKMYPEFIDQARRDNNAAAQMSFSRANSVERIHHSLFQKALNDLGTGIKIEARPFFVCQVCGNTVYETPDTCPICSAPREKFKKVD